MDSTVYPKDSSVVVNDDKNHGCNDSFHLYHGIDRQGFESRSESRDLSLHHRDSMERNLMFLKESFERRFDKNDFQFSSVQNRLDRLEDVLRRQELDRIRDERNSEREARRLQELRSTLSPLPVASVSID